MWEDLTERKSVQEIILRGELRANICISMILWTGTTKAIRSTFEKPLIGSKSISFMLVTVYVIMVNAGADRSVIGGILNRNLSS